MLPGIPEGAICVQKSDDSLNSAIRTAYRISLRSSSLREPRYPLLGVLFWLLCVSGGHFDVSQKEPSHVQSVVIRKWGVKE